MCGQYEIYSRSSPSKYVYSLIAAPYVRSVSHVFALLYTLADYLDASFTL